MNGARAQDQAPRQRGGPLAVMGFLLAAWILGRVALWESPFPIEVGDLPGTELLLAEDNASHLNLEDLQVVQDGQTSGQAREFALADAISERGELPVSPIRYHPQVSPASLTTPDYSTLPGSTRPGSSSKGFMAGGHQMLMAAAFRVDWAVEAAMAPIPNGAIDRQSGLANASPAPLPPPFIDQGEDLDRWSLDAFAFYREGSNSSLISQGRAPLYGASQVSANLQYRFAPRSGHDPRAYVRAYRALVTGGETEVAAGVSARPIGVIPVRLAAEMRLTDNVFGVEQRPAAYAVTELPTLNLPLDFRLEAYGSAGYVGGRGATPFVDGQAALTRELVRFGGAGSQPIRFSIGGGAWGGAQEDASRIDVGPTMRMDLSVGQVPARLSVDWREQIAGDAAPSSGVAATLSTRF